MRRTNRRSALGITLLLTACAGTGASPGVLARPQPADTSRIRIVIPEVYELANIIIALTTFGQTNPVAVHRTGAYYQRVNTAFSAFRNHPSMRELQFGERETLRQYYDFRDNSSVYVYEDGDIRPNAAARASRHVNIFQERLSAVQSFAEASRFRDFFTANASFYVDQIERYRTVAEVGAMADWLEQEFPGVRYRHYTVVLSPLVYGAHSARFPSSDDAVFFVSGPDVTTGSSTSEGVRKATVQRILFTEIDHAFVNPTTDRHRASITRAFATRAKWTTDASSFYNSPTAVFNEYMTWAAFLLFAHDRLSEPDFETVRRLTVQLMEGGRRFQRFGAFSAQLLALYENRPPGTTVAALFPPIIAWASTN